MSDLELNSLSKQMEDPNWDGALMRTPASRVLKYSSGTHDTSLENGEHAEMTSANAVWYRLSRRTTTRERRALELAATNSLAYARFETNY